jgi:hypothetical protein
VAVQLPLAGSYNSALAIGLKKLGSTTPPATSTLPLGSNVAVWAKRALVRLPVALHIPLAGSYSSALVRELPLYPPATSTLPLGSNVAV